MKTTLQCSAVTGLAVAAMLFGFAGETLAADAAAAESLARQNACFKCHSIDKKKSAPAFKDVAAALKGKPDAEAKLTKHLTTGPRVKFEDGSELSHPVAKTKSPDELKNLVGWILSL